MGVETELKLALTAQMAERVAALSPLVEAGIASHRMLHNIYFDTEDRRLHQAQVALRLRQQDEEIIQTLKTRGASVAGLSRRGEWNWARDQLTLDGALLTESCWPKALADVGVERLESMFRTDFMRTTWDVVGEEGAKVEVALDLGEIRSREHVEPICELELELKAGAESALQALVERLRRAGLEAEPLDISKAERGFRLRGCE